MLRNRTLQYTGKYIEVAEQFRKNGLDEYMIERFIRQIVDEIAKDQNVDLVDATQVKEKDLTEYDAIGFASGIYYGKFHQAVLNFAAVNLPQEKKVFLICTHGGSSAFQSIETILEGKHADLVGKFSCKGYDTYGPFKLVGGIAKGHPDEKDLMAAVDFYKGITT